MPQDGRFFLIANINHFTSLLRNVHLPNSQEMAIRLLLADSRHRLANLDAQAFRGSDLMADQPASPAIPPPKPTEHSAPAAIQRARSRPSAATAAAHLASA
jgi:hypothetical protein